MDPIVGQSQGSFKMKLYITTQQSVSEIQRLLIAIFTRIECSAQISQHTNVSLCYYLECAFQKHNECWLLVFFICFLNILKLRKYVNEPTETKVLRILGYCTSLSLSLSKVCDLCHFSNCASHPLCIFLIVVATKLEEYICIK